MTYKEQLNQPEWEAKRRIILERDSYRCTICGLKRSELTGLSKKFGIVNMSGLFANGYIVSFPYGLNYHDSIRISKGTRFYTAFFIGSRTQPLDLDRLLFGLKCQDHETPLGVMKSCDTLVFYDGTVKEQGLVDLNVHHRYYVSGKLAWEYDNSALQTVCFKCHTLIHQTTEIPCYSDDGRLHSAAIPCWKCNGSGYLEEYHYYHHGVCFTCGGTGDNYQG